MTMDAREALAEVDRLGAVVDGTMADLDAVISFWHPFKLRRAIRADAEAWRQYNVALAEARRLVEEARRLVDLGDESVSKENES